MTNVASDSGPASYFPRRRALWLAFAGLSLIVAFALSLYAIDSQRYARRVDVSKQTMWQIGLALNRYADIHGGGYPPSIDKLIGLGNFTELPQNPFTGRPVRILRPGDAMSIGDIYYLPWTAPGHPAGPFVGFELALVGRPSGRTPQSHVTLHGEQYPAIDTTRIEVTHSTGVNQGLGAAQHDG